MRKLKECASVEAQVLAELDKIPVAERAGQWGTSRRNCIKTFKGVVLKEGLRIQEGRCVWCTLLIGSGGRRTSHRDHIAPKGSYPQWTFLPKNVAVACEYCNGFAVKGSIDTVCTVATDYEQCTFFLVHPYIDEPSDHIEFVQDDGGNGVAIVGKTQKGHWTISKLCLDDAGLTVERAKDFLYLKDSAALPAQYKTLLAKATGRV